MQARGHPPEPGPAKLGSVYTMLTEVLASRGDWRRAKAVRKKAVAAADGVEEEKEELKLPRAFQLLLGTAQVRSLNSTVPSNHRRVKWAHLTRCLRGSTP